MTPIFPNFKNLELNDFDVITAYTNEFEPYSDFNFTSLWTYNTDNKTKWCFLNGNLAIQMSDYIDHSLFTSFLGPKDVINTIETLFEYNQSIGGSKELRIVPDISIDSVRKEISEKYSLTEDPASHDYIYKIQDLIHLKGNKYEKKRGLVNKFKNSYPDHALIELDLKNPKTQDEIIKLVLSWKTNKKLEQEDIEKELEAIKRYFIVSQKIESIPIGIYYNDEIIAFSLEEKMANKYAMGHFGKSNLKYIGINQFTEHAHSVILEKEGCEYINLQQDLGIEGLRLNKLLWRPVKFLKKYTISSMQLY